MKNKIYNISHICFLMLISCFLLGSCMSDTINLDPDKIQEEELDKDNLWGSYLTTMQRRVVPEDVNLFQRSEDLFGNMYSGYFAGTQNWEGGANGTIFGQQSLLQRAAIDTDADWDAPQTAGAKGSTIQR